MDKIEIPKSSSEQQEKEMKLQQRSLEFFSAKLQAIVDEAKEKSRVNLEHSMRNDRDSCFEADPYITLKLLIHIISSAPGVGDISGAIDQLVDGAKDLKPTISPEVLGNREYIKKYLESKTGIMELFQNVKDGNIIF
jgi:hypothetical protein